MRFRADTSDAARTYVLHEPIYAESHRRPYVALRFAGSVLEAAPLVNQCSSPTHTSAEAAGLAIVQPTLIDAVPGDVVDVDVVDWSRISSSQNLDEMVATLATHGRNS